MLDVKEDRYQMSKLESNEYDVICAYRSSDSNPENQQTFASVLMSMVNIQKITFILGDFNFNSSGNESSVLIKVMSDFGFSQLVKEPINNQGGIIDHCYLSNIILPNDVKLTQKPVYYTDHDILEVQYRKPQNIF